MTQADFEGLNASFIADAIQRLHGADFVRQHELLGFSALTSRAALGHAYTVRVKVATSKTGEERRRWFDAIDNAPAGSIFVIQASEDVGAAVFGEMVALRLHAIGLAGAIVDGLSRDIQQIRDIGFPYWTRFITMRGMIPDDADTHVGDEVKIGDVSIKPGDLISADCDGVVVCPKDKVQEVLGVARTFRDSEVLTQHKLRSGGRLLDAYPSKTSIQLGTKH